MRTQLDGVTRERNQYRRQLQALRDALLSASSSSSGSTIEDINIAPNLSSATLSIPPSITNSHDIDFSKSPKIDLSLAFTPLAPSTNNNTKKHSYNNISLF